MPKPRKSLRRFASGDYRFANNLRLLKQLTGKSESARETTKWASCAVKNSVNRTFTDNPLSETAVFATTTITTASNALTLPATNARDDISQPPPSNLTTPKFTKFSKSCQKEEGF